MRDEGDERRRTNINGVNLCMRTILLSSLSSSLSIVVVFFLLVSGFFAAVVLRLPLLLPLSISSLLPTSF